MTIFLASAKQFLTKIIREAHKESMQETSSLVNLSILGFRKQQEPLLLSKKYGVLMEQINLFADCASDIDTLKELHTLLQASYQGTSFKLNTEDYLDKLFVKRLKEIDYALQYFYKKLEKLELLNIPYNEDPFNIYRFFLARYFAKKVAVAYEHGRFDAEQIQSPYPFMSSPVTNSKEFLIVTSLRKCIAKLDELSKKYPHDLALKHEMILMDISELQRQNIDFCESKSIGLLFFTIKPSPGDLHMYMEKAVTEIRSTYNPSSSHMQSGPRLRSAPILS